MRMQGNFGSRKIHGEVSETSMTLGVKKSEHGDHDLWNEVWRNKMTRDKDVIESWMLYTLPGCGQSKG